MKDRSIRADALNLRDRYSGLSEELQFCKEELFKKNERIQALKSEIRKTETEIHQYSKSTVELEQNNIELNRRNEVLSQKYRNELAALQSQLAWMHEGESNGKNLLSSIDVDLKKTNSSLVKIREENEDLRQLHGKMAAQKNSLLAESRDLDYQIQTYKVKIRDNTARLNENLELLKQLNVDYQRILDKLRNMDEKCRRRWPWINRLPPVTAER